MVSDDELDTWRTLGYVVVEGVFDEHEMAAARDELDRLVPTFEQVSDGAAIPPMRGFPYQAPALDSMALHPTLIDFAERALGGDVVLSHSEMLHKYAGTGDFNQNLHLDYPNNTWVVPSATAPDQTASISYLTDVTLDMGPTAVVSTPDSTAWKDHPVLSPDEAPELYAHERLITVPAGSTFFYTQHSFHRGTAITATEGCRHSLHVAFQKSTVTWAGWRGLARDAQAPWFATLVCSLSVHQRSVLGFPKPGDSYWTDETVEGVQLRYPAMDLTPYRERQWA